MAYRVAAELLLGIRAAGIRDSRLRDQALRSATSVVCNIAEGSGRVTRKERKRAFTIARGEGVEAFAALEMAGLMGEVEAEHVQRCLPIAGRLYALLTGLIGVRT